MKIRNYKLIGAIAATWFVTACSSTPTDRTATTERDEYVALVNERLHEVLEKTDDLPPARAAELRASIADTRVELHKVQTANPNSWIFHRSEVDNRVSRIENRYRVVAE